MAPRTDLDGRVLALDGGDGAPHLDPRTEVRLRQRDDLVWGRYSGGPVRLGFLVGTLDGEVLRLRATHVATDGAPLAGAWDPAVTADADGRVRLRGMWSWDDGAGGVVALREVARGPASRRG